MLEIRPNCECCDRDLAADDPQVYICTFECTWCAVCVDHFEDRACPNCGGNLTPRPIRPARLLRDNPPSSKRVVNPNCLSRFARA
ncbi:MULTISPECIES: DUF1272 domain-containing protein [Glutamicibacter]|uniref:DUF1272 domain-containing protein n=1 Tax=Glutamicibacter TaxID=1742989 RepID=UPI00195BCA69|nr:DUF1272 domain-containing protein [Glutamicibacter nicotianae]